MYKEGDKVSVIQRDVTADDRKNRMYYQHMAGLVGTVQNVYSENEIAVKIDVPCLDGVVKDVHTKSQDRMRNKFLKSISEEQKGKLSPEEKNFNAHYVLLVRSADLVKA